MTQEERRENWAELEAEFETRDVLFHRKTAVRINCHFSVKLLYIGLEMLFSETIFLLLQKSKRKLQKASLQLLLVYLELMQSPVWTFSHLQLINTHA